MAGRGGIELDVFFEIEIPIIRIDAGIVIDIPGSGDRALGKNRRRPAADKPFGLADDVTPQREVERGVIDLSDKLEELRFVTHGPSSKTGSEIVVNTRSRIAQSRWRHRRHAALADIGIIDATANQDLDGSDGEADASVKCGACPLQDGRRRLWAKGLAFSRSEMRIGVPGMSKDSRSELTR